MAGSTRHCVCGPLYKQLGATVSWGIFFFYEEPRCPHVSSCPAELHRYTLSETQRRELMDSRAEGTGSQAALEFTCTQWNAWGNLRHLHVHMPQCVAYSLFHIIYLVFRGKKKGCTSGWKASCRSAFPSRWRMPGMPSSLGRTPCWGLFCKQWSSDLHPWPKQPNK